MNKAALGAIEQNMSNLLRRRPNRPSWPNELIVASEDGSVFDPLGDFTTAAILAEIEDRLYLNDDDSSLEVTDDQRANLVDNLPSPQEQDIIIAKIEIAPPYEPGIPSKLRDILQTLHSKFGDDFPGSPGLKYDPANFGTGAYNPPPDVYAFYLPWHFFDADTWGIYLIVEGIEAFAQELRLRVGPYLSASDCRRVAKQFLFHHEAYHNAVETFGARLEISHRSPCYVAGFLGPWNAGFMGGTLHEEGLANAYAALAVKRDAFSDVQGPGPVRTFKRKCALAALTNLFKLMPSVYQSAIAILNSMPSFDDAENAFQEESFRACFGTAPVMPPKIWEASPHAMHPSLSRNKSFSYVIARSHPAVRMAVNVPHLKRREVLKRLTILTNGREVSGGKHPKYEHANGKTVPIPDHPGDMSPDTIRKILRQLGIHLSLRRFIDIA